MGTLEEDIKEITELHKCRKLAFELYKESLQAITCNEYTADRSGWDDPGDEIECSLLLKAIQKARYNNVSLGNMSENNVDRLLEKISDIPLADLFHKNLTNVPVFTAARTMQALLLVPGNVICRTTLRCYFRIIRELYNTVPPKWITGGAKAAADANQTAFITSECIRALLTFSDILGRTAALFDELESSKRKRNLLSKSKEMPEKWLEQEKNRCSLSFFIKLHSLGTGIVPNLHPLPMEICNIESFRATLPSVLVSQAETAIKDLDVVINEAKKYRETESDNGDKWIDRTESSHREAMRALDRAKNFTQTIKKCLDGQTDWLSVDWADIAEVFRNAGNTVRKVLLPAKNFMENILDRELAEAKISQDYNFDMAELAFAAASYGAIAKAWNDDRLLKVAQHLMSKVSGKGGIVRKEPIIDIGKGYILVAHGYEVIRAMALLFENIDLNVDAKLINRFLERIKREKNTSEDINNFPGWTHKENAYPNPSEWWTTALVVHATNRLFCMLNKKINDAISGHFFVKMPGELKLDLDDLFIPDIGLLDNAGDHQRSISVLLQRMHAHLLKTSVPDEYGSNCYSAILHGPPGTGKTTMLESLAKTANVPLIEITPSNIIVGGAEAVEQKAKVVFDALSMLTKCVIIFDEFDPVLRKRSPNDGTPENVFAFLTPGMLPKLRKLNEAAEKQSFIYALCTNLIGTLDDAIIREGRFDEKMGLYPPDLLSRAGRMISQIMQLQDKNGIIPSEQWQKRAADVVIHTSGGPMTVLGKPGWYSLPPKMNIKKGTALDYIINDAIQMFRWPESEKKFPSCPETSEDSNRFSKREWNEWNWVNDWDNAAKEARTWTALVRILDRPPTMKN